MLHGECAAWFPADRPTTITGFGINGSMIRRSYFAMAGYAPCGRGNFSGLTALTAEFTVGEGKLMTMMNPVPWLQMTNMIPYQELVRIKLRGLLYSMMNFISVVYLI